MKSDLETNLEALLQEIDFLKGLYEEVPAAPLPAGAWSGGGSVGRTEWESSSGDSGQADSKVQWGEIKQTAGLPGSETPRNQRVQTLALGSL